MGQKVNPNMARLGITKQWHSVWYADKKSFVKYIHNDFEIRRFLKRRLFNAGISHIIIERPAKSVLITIYSSRPGIILGKRGEEIESLSKEVNKITGVSVKINISEIKRPELSANLVSKNVALQIEKRIMFRRAIKRAMNSVLRSGGKGIKISISGRLNGAEIARTEWYREGRIPLHTFRADIDYSSAIARTNYGSIGIKVWIFKGEILGNIKYYNTSGNEILNTRRFFKKS
ncbi:MAG: 30S ribosomal protein S3 [Enterobacteriaceae bacterium]